MGKFLNRLLDRLSDFFARRKGLLPTTGIAFIIANYLLQFIITSGWFVESNLLLHLGIIIAILGILLAWAL